MMKHFTILSFYGSVSYLARPSYRKVYDEAGGGIWKEHCEYLHLDPNCYILLSFILLVTVFFSCQAISLVFICCQYVNFLLQLLCCF